MISHQAVWYFALWTKVKNPYQINCFLSQPYPLKMLPQLSEQLFWQTKNPRQNDNLLRRLAVPDTQN